MTDISEQDWKLLRYVYGDLAYEEEPKRHASMLKSARETVLFEYSKGRMKARAVADLLGLRDSANLLVALGDAGLPMPQPPEAEVREQAETFAKLFLENQEAKRQAALEIFDRAPDVPPDPGDEPPE